MAPFDFDGLRTDLETAHPSIEIRDVDLSSAAQYPAVFKEYAEMKAKYGDLSVMPTRQFLEPMVPGDSCLIPSRSGVEMSVKYLGTGDYSEATGMLEVLFEVDGQSRSTFVVPKNPAAHTKKAPAPSVGGVVAEVAAATGEKADAAKPGHVGAPMPGAVLSVNVGAGDDVKSGDKVAVLSAMKMETNVTAPIDGTVARVLVGEGDEVEVGDLLIDIE